MQKKRKIISHSLLLAAFWTGGSILDGDTNWWELEVSGLLAMTSWILVSSFCLVWAFQRAVAYDPDASVRANIRLSLRGCIILLVTVATVLAVRLISFHFWPPSDATDIASDASSLSETGAEAVLIAGFWIALFFVVLVAGIFLRLRSPGSD